MEEAEAAKIQNRGWNFLKKHKWLVVTVVIAGIILLWAPSVYTNLSTKSKRYDLTKTSVQNIPKMKVAIVPGAGVLPSGKPTPYLQNRIATSVKLYKEHRVQKIIMSGDNSTKKYNEPKVMKDVAVKLGVKSDDVVIDYAGFSTYDTCYRARHIFNIGEATIITQGYHLPRAVKTCNGLGINTIGVSALKSGRDFTVSYIAREWLSTDKALLQIIIKPNPTVLGKPEPIN
jgi:vancomycin permeability regulator SanA